MKDTIVTAVYYYSYYSRMGGRNYNFEYYKSQFVNMLNLNTNIVVFSHASEIADIKSFFELYGFVDYKIIEHELDNYEFSDMIYNIKESKGLIDKNGLVEGNSVIMNDRNTHLCLSKIEFLNIAITNNYFDSDNYYWADIGLFHHGIIPYSFGGQERYIKAVQERYWPHNKNNICTPDLIGKLNAKNNNNKLLFIGLTNFPIPEWWDSIFEHKKQVHIIGGMFGGDKNEVVKIYPIFREMTEKVLKSNELTLEEDILSSIVAKNNYAYLQFDVWYHDVPTDPCYYGITSDQNSFYKVFL